MAFKARRALATIEQADVRLEARHHGRLQQAVRVRRFLHRVHLTVVTFSSDIGAIIASIDHEGHELLHHPAMKTLLAPKSQA